MRVNVRRTELPRRVQVPRYCVVAYDDLAECETQILLENVKVLLEVNFIFDEKLSLTRLYCGGIVPMHWHLCSCPHSDSPSPTRRTSEPDVATQQSRHCQSVPLQTGQPSVPSGYWECRTNRAEWIESQRSGMSGRDKWLAFSSEVWRNYLLHRHHVTRTKKNTEITKCECATERTRIRVRNRRQSRTVAFMRITKAIIDWSSPDLSRREAWKFKALAMTYYLTYEKSIQNLLSVSLSLSLLCSPCALFSQAWIRIEKDTFIKTLAHNDKPFSAFAEKFDILTVVCQLITHIWPAAQLCG